MLKKFYIILIVILLLVVVSGNVLAKDTITATSTISGVTVNWQYELNESNQIENLKCTNPEELTGSFLIPATIDGKTVISLGNEAFKEATKVTEITIPSTVKEIGLWAFSECTNLSKVDLGSVERISDQSFKNCTALTNIRIPKTVNGNAAGAPFSGCTNLKNIELEEGMTVVPNYICAKTPITEITIPSTVKEIGLWAFSECTALNKITILDNVDTMGGYNSSESDLVFKNHNEDLTIYCYKDSMAAKYAIKYNIKYVYLTKPIEENGEKQDPIIENGKDNTVATGKLPNAGTGITIVISIFAITMLAVILYKKYYEYRDIK